MSEAIAVSGLRKSYGRTVALDGLDLSVAEGEVHGFLGPNGSGKTTTIRILLGLLRAGGGPARLRGGDPWREATALHRRLAYVPGDVPLWPTFTGGEVIDLLGRLRGGVDAKRRASLLERFDLDPTKKARAYSKGNRQKVALISALASDVELLILDEPTSGLDPLMEAAFRDCIEEERHSGRTVLLSSHILSEVEALCERVTIIRAGRAVESGTLAGLRHLTTTSIAADLARHPAGLEQLPGVLARLAARRDRVMLPAWIYVITILVVSTGYSFKGLYKTPASREAVAAGISHNAATLALGGPLYGTSTGALTVYKVGAASAFAAGLMSIFIVIRHTRADEEAGRLDLVGSTAVGRDAAPAVGGLLAALAHRLLALLIFSRQARLGLPAGGSAALGLAGGSSRLFFPAVSAGATPGGRGGPRGPGAPPRAPPAPPPVGGARGAGGAPRPGG